MNKKERVLKWCNGIREQLGRKPLPRLRRGEQNDGARCALANTIVGVSVYDMVYTEDGALPYPKYVGDFISDFDNGKYPELIK